MIKVAGVDPDPLRPIRPGRAQRPIEKELAESLTDESRTQAEIGQLNFDGAATIEFRIPGRLARDAQNINFYTIVAQNRLQVLIGHDEPIDPMKVRPDSAV